MLNANTIHIRVDSDEAYLIDLADIHIGSIFHNKKELSKVVEFIANTPNLYWIGGGDTTEHAMIGSKSSVFDEQSHGIDQILELRNILLPIKDKGLFIKSGNHGQKRAYNSNKLPPEQVLAELLGIPYFRGIGIALINVRKNLYSIAAFHTTKKQEEKFDWLNVDAVFIEHQHTKYHNRLPIAYLNRQAHKWTFRDRLYVRAGSFLSWGGYSMEEYRPLSSNGGQILCLSGLKDQWDMRVVERLRDFKL